MPGLVGSSGFDLESEFRTVQGMQNLLLRTTDSIAKPVFQDPNVCATYVVAPQIPVQQTYWTNSIIHLWFDGELYDRAEKSTPLSVSEGSDASFVARSYCYYKDLSFLRQVDGVFAGILYDSACKRLYAFTDRHGLRHLYWLAENNGFAWASEVKAFLSHSAFTPSLSAETLESFFDIGYALGDATWFRQVRLIPPASVLTWDLVTRHHETHQYWSWTDVKRLVVEDEREVVEELGYRFVKAVQRRCRPGERVGLSLSGGLDSRAILAAMETRPTEPIHTVTYGNRSCDDVRIATRCAQRKGALLHPVDLNAENWLAPRFDNIWATDGQFNLLHMHGVTAYREASQFMDVCLTGYLGDATIGGSYLGD